MEQKQKTTTILISVMFVLTLVFVGVYFWWSNNLPPDVEPQFVKSHKNTNQADPLVTQDELTSFGNSADDVEGVFENVLEEEGLDEEDKSAEDALDDKDLDGLFEEELLSE